VLPAILTSENAVHSPGKYMDDAKGFREKIGLAISDLIPMTADKAGGAPGAAMAERLSDKGHAKELIHSLPGTASRRLRV